MAPKASFFQSMVVDATAGNERFKADKRQQSGILFGLSIVACFFNLATLAGLISRDGATPTDGIDLARVIAGLCITAIGLTGMVTSYLSLVHDYGNLLLSGFLLVILQTAWIPYLTDMTNVGRIARSGAGFISPALNPTASDVEFVGAMGVMGIFSYGFCFLGSLGFMSFSLYAYQAGKPGDRASGYYRSRLRVYAFMVFVAGLAQLLLGAYTLSVFGSGPLPDAINVTQFTVFFPEISIAVGLVYIVVSIYGIARAFGVNNSHDDHSYQFAILVQYVCTLVLQIMVQVFYAPGGQFAGAAPSRACITLGAHVITAYLDFKMRTTPAELPMDYYGLEKKKESAAVASAEENV